MHTSQIKLPAFAKPKRTYEAHKRSIQRRAGTDLGDLAAEGDGERLSTTSSSSSDEAYPAINESAILCGLFRASCTAAPPNGKVRPSAQWCFAVLQRSITSASSYPLVRSSLAFDWIPYSQSRTFDSLAFCICSDRHCDGSGLAQYTPAPTRADSTVVKYHHVERGPHCKWNGAWSQG